MKEVIPQKKISAKKIWTQGGLFEREIKSSMSSCIPGEWVSIQCGNEERFIGYVNKVSSAIPMVRVAGKQFGSFIDGDEKLIALEFITNKLKESVDYRSSFRGNARLVYGQNDGLPGLIVDSYLNCILIQITSAGMDRFRLEIKQWFESIFPEKKVVLFDKQTLRQKEDLPVYDGDLLPEFIEIEENGLRYLIRSEIIQKNGYYYDHRNNRKKLLEFISQKKNIQNGLDLYCYLGSWGMHLLKAGVKEVDFVDQGNFSLEVTKIKEKNGLEGKLNFHQKNVFDFVSDCIKKNAKFDVIVCDPPAFSKNKSGLRSAREGYSKLYANCFRIINSDGFMVAASCTHGISFEELSKIVHDAALVNHCQVRLLDMGVQGEDHPLSSLVEQGCYIKYLLFSVKRMGDTNEY